MMPETNGIIQKNIVIDGITVGFSAIYKGTNKLIKFTNNLTRFRNLELLAAEVEKSGIINYEIGITDGTVFTSWKYITPTDEGEFMYFSSDGRYLIFAKPTVKEKVILSGYYLFGDNPREKIADNKYGKELNRKNFTLLQSSFSKELRRGTFRSCYKDENNFLTFDFRESTAKIKIVANNKLVDYNKQRKEDQKKVLPFDKNLDKFKTIYFYVTKETKDTMDEKIIKENVNNIIDKILDNLGDEEEIKKGITTGVIYNDFHHFVLV